MRVRVKQFSIFADNKVGRMHDIVMALADGDVSTLGFCTLDTTDSAIVRLVVDYWQQARNLFHGLGITFVLGDVVAVEMQTVRSIQDVTRALMQAEVNIHYTYPLLMRPNGRCGLVIQVDDHDVAEDVLRSTGITVLDHADLAR